MSTTKEMIDTIRSQERAMRHRTGHAPTLGDRHRRMD